MNLIITYIAMFWGVLSFLSFGVAFYGYTQVDRIDALLAVEDVVRDTASLRLVQAYRQKLRTQRRQFIRYTMNALLLGGMLLVGAGLLGLVVVQNLMAHL